MATPQTQKKVPFHQVFSHQHAVQINMTEGQTVRWLLLDMGTNNDMHTPVFHNQVCLISQALLTPLSRSVFTIMGHLSLVSPRTYVFVPSLSH